VVWVREEAPYLTVPRAHLPCSATVARVNGGGTVAAGVGLVGVKTEDKEAGVTQPDEIWGVGMGVECIGERRR
jgi:hypothetical protein